MITELSHLIPQDSSWNIADLVIALALVFTFHKGWVRGLRGTTIIYGCIGAAILAAELLLPKLLRSLTEKHTREIVSWILIIFFCVLGYIIGSIMVGLLGTGESAGILGIINRSGGALVHTCAFSIVAGVLYLTVGTLTPAQLQHTVSHSATVGFFYQNSPSWIKELPEKMQREITAYPHIIKEQSIPSKS